MEQSGFNRKGNKVRDVDFSVYNRNICGIDTSEIPVENAYRFHEYLGERIRETAPDLLSLRTALEWLVEQRGTEEVNEVLSTLCGDWTATEYLRQWEEDEGCFNETNYNIFMDDLLYLADPNRHDPVEIYESVGEIWTNYDEWAQQNSYRAETMDLLYEALFGIRFVDALQAML